MQIRKNTKAFKTILEIISACQERPDRDKLVRLYITKAGDTVAKRINVEGIQGDVGLFYEMNYQAVLNSLKSSNHQLNVSDDEPGIYFFRSSSNKTWDETPFEFDDAVKKEFSSLPDLPVTRKKEKAEKFVIPSPSLRREAPIEKKSVAKTTERKKKVKMETKTSRQPNYKLRHMFEFTNLEKVIFRQQNLNKEKILDYYNDISDYLLRYLKEREIENVDKLVEINNDEIPEWIIGARQCNDREHLLFYVEKGAIEFKPSHHRARNSASPDYFVVRLESPDTSMARVAVVARILKQILDGLKLPSFVKSDGQSGLHVYVPLDTKSNYDVVKAAAEYVCKLLRLKVPDMVTVKGLDEFVFGKVAVDYLLNEADKTVVAPYSLVSGQNAAVAAPLLWEEVTETLSVEAFNHESIFKRLKRTGDPFENLYKKKINADELYENLKINYGFLL